MKYPIGTEIIYKGVRGVVVDHYTKGVIAELVDGRKVWI